MTCKIHIVDYGSGNLASICSAFAHLGARPVLTADSRGISRAERLVLPGVGAFGKGMQALNRQGLNEAIVDYCGADRPFLGICLGMQMLVDSSEEFGRTAGLGAITGTNRRIPATDGQGRPHKVPHIGWAPIMVAGVGLTWQGTILDGLTPGAFFYFVHSYAVVTPDERVRLADTEYNGRRITAVLGRGRVYGTQFHPEKSGGVGLKVLENFLRL